MSEKSKENKNIFAEFEDQVLDFWNTNDIFKKSVNKEAPNGDYVFYDGPPFATGTPHYGHIVGSVMKDVVPRFWTMQGYRVERRWGWDCHGLPIENIVEKEMGTESKKDIVDTGIEEFNMSCQTKVLKYADEWRRVIDKLGRWAEMDSSYKTMDLDYMESVWWVFKTLWDKDLIYKGYRSMHVCPRCETTLSQSEVTEGYKDIKDFSVTAKFKLKDQDKTHILAWTTTPWTLIGNVALAVGEDIEYVKVEHEGEYYILAKERLEEVFKEKDYKIEELLYAKDLVALRYEPVFPYYQNADLKNIENAWQVQSADFVNTEEGTGIVHIAPAFGEDDLNLGKAKNLPFIQHIDIGGRFKEEVHDFQDMTVKPKADHMATDVEVIKYLAHHDRLFSKEKYEHSYPHCWRCETPLINYATSS
jgi:isoleucyl-tRNA synthetase